MSSHIRSKVQRGRGRKIRGATRIPSRTSRSGGRGRGKPRQITRRKIGGPRREPTPAEREAPDFWRDSLSERSLGQGERLGPIRVVEPGQKDKGKEPPSYSYRRSEEERRRGEDAASVFDVPMVGSEVDAELEAFIPTSLNLSLFSFEEMEMVNVRDITVPITKGNEDHSVNDPRLGPYDPLASCKECEETDCPGHYGLIRFPEKYPIPNPILLVYISRVLSCVCNDCSDLLVPKETLEGKGILNLMTIDRFNAITSMCQTLSCPRKKKSITEGEDEGKGKEAEEVEFEEGPLKVCSSNPKFYPGHSKQEGWIAYKKSEKEKDYSMMDPYKIFQILNRISDENAELMGFPGGNHPRDMILRGLLVIPTSARPPFVQGANVQCDQLTEIYNKIVRLNESLKVKIKSSDDFEGGRCECYKDLVAAVREIMIGNNSKKYQNRPMMDLAKRLQGKNGLFRRLLMGKRTDYCARTVLGPDTSLKFGQIRIPQYIADRLTKKVRVFEYNKKAIQKMTEEGKILYITDPKKGFTRRYRKGNKVPIRVGLVVERKLQNGDRIMFNRQPTLHKYSLMSYEVVIGKQATIGLHLSVTVPHNADFDGDEGNLWALLDLMAVAEGKFLTDVRQCLISSQTNAAIIGLIMDTVTGLYILTSFDILFSRDQFQSFLSVLTRRDQLATLSQRARKHGIHQYSGKALFSALLPKDFYYKKGDVEIVEGILIHGRMKKEQMGPTHRSIVQELWKDIRYGPSRAADFLTDAPYLATAFLDDHGFSVGITDCAPESEKLRARIVEEIAKVRTEHKALLDIEPKSKIEEEYIEQEIVAVLTGLTSMGLKIQDEFPEDNAVRIMSKKIGGGAKGDIPNVTQMAAVLGEQFIFGKRPEKQITGKTRTLCAFEPGSKSMESQGCVFHSFSEGLTMTEFFFHAMASRQGLMDTAVKTSEIGSIHHKMVKAVEGVTVAYDGSVRNQFGTIIQFAYGNDGFDASQLVSVSTHGTQNLAIFMDFKMTAARMNVDRGWAPRKTAGRILQGRRKLLHTLRKERFELT